jgi:Zn finger protein HypA/HybF involved in hydrogenase expression
MYISYPNNDVSTQVQYVRNKIGNNYFIVYYKNAARFCFTPKEVGRVFGMAKFTPYVNNLRDWCKEMVEKYDSIEQEPVSIDKATGFGPECHDDEVEVIEKDKMVL